MRLVFDSNIVISALIFSNNQTNLLRQAWEQSILIPIIAKETVEELLRVLAYPKFQLSTDEQEILLSSYLQNAEICQNIQCYSRDFLCRDPFDQKFIDLALSSQAQGIMTGDQDLLVMQKSLPLPVYELKDLKNLLNPKH